MFAVKTQKASHGVYAPQLKQHRSVYQRVLEFFRITSVAALPMTRDAGISKPSLPIYADIIPPTQQPEPDEKPRSADPLSPEAAFRSDLEKEITYLFKKVWLGLYQIHDQTGPYQHGRLEALFLGAGFTRTYRSDDLCAVLDRQFREYGNNKGVANLKLYWNLSISTLQSIIDLLMAYEREIGNLEKLYARLRALQVDVANGAERGYGRDVGVYLEIAKPMAKRLLVYDARMDVLNLDVYDEAMALHWGDARGRMGEFVYYRAFPTRA